MILTEPINHSSTLENFENMKVTILGQILLQDLYLTNQFSTLQARIEELKTRSLVDMLHFAVDFYNTHMCAAIPAANGGQSKFQNSKLVAFLKTKNRNLAINTCPKAWQQVY